MDHHELFEESLSDSSEQVRGVFFLASQNIATNTNYIEQLGRESYIAENARGAYARSAIRQCFFVLFVLAAFWFFDIDHLGNLWAFYFLLANAATIAALTVLFAQCKLGVEQLKGRIQVAERSAHYSLFRDEEDNAKVDYELLLRIRRTLL